jgi:hypothetical protein
MQIQSAIITTLVITLASMAAAGSSKTRKSGMSIEQSGSLADYLRLSETDSAIPGESESRSRLRYINPDADWPAYRKVLVDPVSFFCSEDVNPPREVQTILNHLWAELRKELKQDYELVDSPQLGTLRISIALFGPTLAERQGIERSKPSFLAYAMAEAKFTDAESGSLLAAAIDKRIGGETFKNFDSWSDVRAAVDLWAKFIVFRLCLLRGESDCIPPTESK